MSNNQYSSGSDPIQPPSYVEGIQHNEGDTLGRDMSDGALVQMMKADITRNQSGFAELRKKKKEAFGYWRGDQPTNQYGVVGQFEVVVNRIFTSIETMIANVTGETPLPWVTVFPKSRKGRNLSEKLERWLRDAWEYEFNMQQIFEKLLRGYYVSRVGVLKYGYDPVAERPFTNIIDLESIVFDLTAKTIDESPFVAQYVREPLGAVVSKFEDKADEIKRATGVKNPHNRDMITYVEYWVDFYEKGKKHTMLTHIFQDVVMNREVDPYWGKKNHYTQPRKPFIPMNSISINNSIVDDTSQIEQAIPLQNAINRRKEQIEENAKWSNGIMVTTARGMDGETFGKLDAATRKVRLDNEVESINAAFGVITGQPFSSGIFTDQADSKAELDNIMGTHDVTRGERGPGETLGGQALRQQADLGRLDLTMRAYSQVAEDWYNAMVQLMYVFDMEDIKILSEPEESLPDQDHIRRSGFVPVDDTQDTISKKEIQDYKIKVIVKRNAVPVKTPAAMQEAALTLMQTGMIDPFLFAEMYGLENPRRIARRAYLYQTDPASLFPELAGEEMTEPQAIQHIESILNSEGTELEESIRLIFSDISDPLNMTPEDLEAFGKHLNTQDLYMKGVEIDEDLPAFDTLSDEKKEAIVRHIAIEAGIVALATENLTNTGQIPPEEPVAEAAPMMDGPVTQPIEQITQPL
jgi:hypothetical protein